MNTSRVALYSLPREAMSLGSLASLGSLSRLSSSLVLGIPIERIQMTQTPLCRRSLLREAHSEEVRMDNNDQRGHYISLHVRQTFNYFLKSFEQITFHEGLCPIQATDKPVWWSLPGETMVNSLWESPLLHSHLRMLGTSRAKVK